MCEYIGGPPCGPVWCPCDYLYWEDTALGWVTKAGNNCDVFGWSDVVRRWYYWLCCVTSDCVLVITFIGRTHIATFPVSLLTHLHIVPNEWIERCDTQSIKLLIIFDSDTGDPDFMIRLFIEPQGRQAQGEKSLCQKFHIVVSSPCFLPFLNRCLIIVLIKIGRQW